MRCCYRPSAIVIVILGALYGPASGIAVGQTAVGQVERVAVQQPDQSVDSAPTALQGVELTGSRQSAARRPQLPGLAPVRPSLAAAELGDWRQPTYTDERVSTPVRRMWVQLTTNGNVIGRFFVYDGQGNIRPAADMQVQFLQAGRIIAQTHTDVKGVFLTTLPPGVYSLVGIGDIGLVATSLTVLPFIHSPRDDRQEDARDETEPAPGLDDLLSLDVAIFPGPLDPTWELLQRNYVRMQLPVLPEVARQGQGLQPIEERMLRFGMADWIDALTQPDVRPLVEALPYATNIRGHTLVLSEDGRLRGRALRIDPVSGRPVLVRRAEAFLVRDGAIIHRAEVGPDGVFEMLQVEPGPYGLAVAGQDGFAALGVTVVAKNPELSSTIGDAYFVALNNTQQPEPLNLVVSLITDPRDLVTAFGGTRPLGALSPLVSPTGGGGGGGGGGGFDEGPLTGLIGAAITAGALASDRDQGSPVGP